MGRKTSARKTRPSSMVIGTSQSMRIPSRVSLRASRDLAPAAARAMRASPSSDDIAFLQALMYPSCRVNPVGTPKVSMAFRGSLPPLHARHLLKHSTDSGSIVVVMAAFARLSIDRARGVEHRRRHADVAGKTADHV